MNVASISNRTPQGRFAPRRVALSTLPLLGLGLWLLAFAGLATAGSTATADSPARVTVALPQRDAAVAMLELELAVVRKPAEGHLGAVVRLKAASGEPTEVGRVTLTGGRQSYQFNVSRVLSRAPAGSAEVEVVLIDRGGGPAPSGAELAIGAARIVAR